MNSLLENEAQIRLFAFLGIFLIMAIWEMRAPYRELRYNRIQRWPHQIGLIVVNSLLLRVIFPTAAVGTAFYAQQNNWGVLNWSGLPDFITIFVGFILLDFVIYWQHVIAHRWNWFWKLHRTHHADTDFDLTTGLRFHPLEIILSMLIKIVVVFLLGTPVIAVIVFEIVLSGSAMFNHSNIRLPQNIEPWIRKLIVTPSMHRVHHSTERFEHDSNYGFFLSIWDRLFGSYTEKAEQNDQTMPIGLKHFRDNEDKQLDRILSMPFRE